MRRPTCASAARSSAPMRCSTSRTRSMRWWTIASRWASGPRPEEARSARPSVDQLVLQRRITGTREPIRSGPHIENVSMAFMPDIQFSEILHEEQSSMPALGDRSKRDIDKRIRSDRQIAKPSNRQTRTVIGGGCWVTSPGFWVSGLITQDSRLRTGNPKPATDNRPGQ